MTRTEQAVQLLKLYARITDKHEFKPGQLVCWKPGLAPDDENPEQVFVYMGVGSRGGRRYGYLTDRQYFTTGYLPDDRLMPYYPSDNDLISSDEPLAPGAPE